MGFHPLLTATRLTSLLLLCMLTAYYASGSFVIKSYIPRGFNCNFKSNACKWKNALRYERLDDFNWKWGSGSTGRQRGSGTNDDRSEGGGYMFIKSRKSMNRTAKLISPYFRVGVASCFKFWYFMKGRTMGHLAVQLASARSQAKTNSKVLWNLKGHQGNVWKNATIPLPAPTSGVLIFEAFDWEIGRSGNILIDEVMLTSQDAGCRSIYPPYAAPADAIATTIKSTTGTTEANSGTTPMTRVLTTDNMTPLRMYTDPRTAVTMVADFTSKRNQRDFTANFTSTLIVTQKQQVNTTITKRTATAATMEAVSVSTELTNDIILSTIKKEVPFTSLAMNQTWPGNEEVQAIAKSTQTALIAAAVVIVVIAILVVSLVLYSKRRKKQRTPFVDNCSVIMTRMYPEITTEPSIDYRKFN